MPEDFVKREEYNQGQVRIHERVDAISQDVAEIKVCTKIIKDSVQDMHKVIYGNGKNGLTNKITKLFERVSLHTKIIVGTLMFIIGGFVTLIFRLIVK